MNDNDRTIELLEELVAWARFANRDALVRMLDHTLAEDRHLLAYDLTDGTKTQVEIASATGLAQSTVSALWTKWRRMGLARERAGRVTHLVKPADVGLDRALKIPQRQKGAGAAGPQPVAPDA